MWKCVEFIGTEADIDLYKLMLINYVAYIWILCKKIYHPKIIYMLEIKRKKKHDFNKTEMRATIPGWVPHRLSVLKAIKKTWMIPKQC